MYYIYWRGKFSHVKAFSEKTIKYLLLQDLFTFPFFPLCSLLFPVCVCMRVCVCVCVCANCFVFLEIKNTKTEYFLIRVSLADLGSIE